jgi:light-regulated signal transduction histidine kinase (bacteriophytochrome)
MEELIKDLLVYSRVVHPDQEREQPADLNRSLGEALSVLKVRVEESGAIVVPDSLPVVSGEERQFALVFQNLLANAVKYAQKGVRPLIAITAEPSGENWLIRVRDNGIGLDPAHAERIFGLFKRLHKDEYPGTGLGLAICKRIVERYKGCIWAESEGEGKGATFTMVLRSASL